ncbi:MAG: hypothetical protein ABSB00_03330 [Minisyncoccia bacterium]|jgi:hypothetical protein
MPQKKNSQPPKVMTWGKALPELCASGISDALRYMFLSFWFFGPALGGVICTLTVSGTIKTWTVGLLGAKTAAAVCGAGATAVGYFAAPVIAAFGTVMAMAVGFLGWLIVTFIIFAKNGRVFKENSFSILWLLAGIGASISLMTWRIYAPEIKKDKAAYEKWKKEQDNDPLREQKQRAAELMQARAAQLVQAEI